MKALLPLLTLLFLSVSLVSAQATPIPDNDWTTIQRCITAPSTPPQGWTYDGVIFTYGEGLHARRADVATPYFVGYDKDNFDEIGSLSPDGRWLAELAGRTSSMDNGSMDSEFDVEEIRVYSTSPAQTLFRIPFYNFDVGIRPYYTLLMIHWLDSENVVATGSISEGGAQHVYVINPFKGTIKLMNLPDGAILLSASPDTTRWLYYQPDSLNQLIPKIQLMSNNDSNLSVIIPIQAMFNAMLTPLAQWTADSSKFAAVLSDGTGIGIFDRDGNLIDKIPSDDYVHLSFAHDGKHLAYMTRSDSIHVAGFETRTITDTCIRTENGLEYSLALSPEGNQLAFPLPKAGYVYILDLQAWQAYRIDLVAADVIGWYPVE